MKRIVALLLALAMLLGMTGLAAPQSALISNLTGITLEFINGTETQTIGLDDLGVSFVIDTEGALHFVLTVDKGGENLTFAVVEVNGNRVRVGLKGVDRAFEEEIPDMPAVDVSSLASSIRANLPELMSARLPEIRVPAMPKLDITPLVGAFGKKTEFGDVTTTEVDIPASVVSALLKQFISIVRSSAASTPQGDQVAVFLEQIQESGFSFAIRGTITDIGVEQNSNFGIYLVNGEETASDPTLYLNTASAENSFILAVDLPSADASYTIGQLKIATDPVKQTINCGLDFGGMASIEAKTYKQPDTALQCVDLTSKLPGIDVAAQLLYGTQGGNDYYAFKASLGENASVSGEVTGEDIESGRTGTLRFSASGQDATINFAGTCFEFLDDFDMDTALGGYTLPAGSASFDSITEEEINAAIRPVLETFSAIFDVDEAA